MPRCLSVTFYHRIWWTNPRQTTQKMFSKIILKLKLLLNTRVEVSETISADQLWLRLISGLFQCCSLPENFWTALSQLWTALKTKIFRAKSKRWNSVVSALIFSEIALIQGWTALISSETALNSVDFWRIQNDNLWFLLNFFVKFLEVPQFRGTKIRFSTQFAKRS